MVQINGDRMAVLKHLMQVLMTMRFLPLKAFVVMLMVLIMYVQVLMTKRLMAMLERHRVVPRPNPSRRER